MRLSVAQLAHNIDELVKQAAYEDIYIEQNGNDIAKLTRVRSSKKGLADQLIAILPSDANIDEAKEERLKKYNEYLARHKLLNKHGEHYGLSMLIAGSNKQIYRSGKSSLYRVSPIRQRARQACCSGACG